MQSLLGLMLVGFCPLIFPYELFDPSLNSFSSFPGDFPFNGFQVPQYPTASPQSPAPFDPWSSFAQQASFVMPSDFPTQQFPATSFQSVSSTAPVPWPTFFSPQPPTDVPAQVPFFQVNPQAPGVFSIGLDPALAVLPTLPSSPFLPLQGVPGLPPLYSGSLHFDLRGLRKGPDQTTERVPVLLPVAPERVQEASTDFPQDPRPIAEWEPVQGALIRYPLGISLEFVKLIADELMVYCLCIDRLIPVATQGFQNAGVKMSNVEFIEMPTDSFWTRDYGPFWIANNEAGDVNTRMVDACYLRELPQRPNDDRVPQILATYFNQPTHYKLDLCVQGGNYMTDQQKGASTERILEDNKPLRGEDVAGVMQQTMGTSSYFITQDPGRKSYIKHIDTWSKFIGPSQVLVKRVPVTDDQFAAFEDAAYLWSTRTNKNGVSYTVYRVDGSSTAPYVNHVILNDRVFVPAMGTSDDAIAQKQIAAAYGPTYRVIMVLAAPLLPWLPTDSLHCRVSAIPVLSIRSGVNATRIPRRALRT